MNLRTVDFLDVFLDLTNRTFKSYKNPNDSTVSIHESSNHQPSIIKELPKSISKRLSNVSSSKEMFGSATYTSQATLSGYKVIITHMKTPTSFHQESKRKRKRKTL